MSKYAVVIEVGRMIKSFEADNPCSIIRSVEKYQDFGCLIRMGRVQEDENGQKELTKLEKFLKKYYSGKLTWKDLKGLNIHLSVGDIVCHNLAKVEEPPEPTEEVK